MKPSSENTVFVLVPGGFCPGSFYHKVTTILQNGGYQVHEIDLPSVGKREGSPATMYDDADHIRSVVSEFADQGKNVVLCANSYGGLVSTEAVKGTTKAEREANGKPGALVHVVFIGSLLAPVGMNAQELVGGKIPLDMKSKPDYIEPIDAEVAGAYLCSDLDDKATQKYYGSLQKPHSAVSFLGRLTHAGYLHVPTTVVVTERDVAISPDVQHKNVDTVIAEGKGNIRKVPMASDHCAMISHPEEIVEILLQTPPGE
ncbi:uncharacterized protein Z518_06897 [Rhinocladiella mackenziei CBS 650.93]|uniref:AB hydrolase-1 domain-containing protein n=1 Tax=Rhinocladiella mackenziei CBS 650.93 TaxID=1442369 RepID=A0A0D2J2Y4_9EURO|nr:uncharacterized protein Z518_06897 [Rhinocladiella mackenziei CBS 650.93]KIX03345.1 hypothetical protein Z518_06897 [Rhinocladiella mackenziei CBS 650.93]